MGSRRLYAYMAGILANLDSHATQIGGVEDHVHVLFRLSKNKSLVEVIQKLKSNSSAWMKVQGESHAHFQWQSGYGAFSIGASGVKQVTQYIQSQRTRHAKLTFQDELRKLLVAYDVEFDERYVWE
jgi:putative transposase